MGNRLRLPWRRFIFPRRSVAMIRSANFFACAEGVFFGCIYIFQKYNTESDLVPLIGARQSKGLLRFRRPALCPLHRGFIELSFVIDDLSLVDLRGGHELVVALLFNLQFVVLDYQQEHCDFV